MIWKQQHDMYSWDVVVWNTMGVGRGILNEHYLIVYKTLKQYVFKEKYTGKESRHQSMCPFHLLSHICRCNKQYNMVPMLLSQSTSWSRSFQKGAEKEGEALGRERDWHDNTAGRRDESTTISAAPKPHASGRAELFYVLQRDDGAT